MTGLWQVVGRGRSDFDDMVRLDLSYRRLQSWFLDLALLAATPFALASTGIKPAPTSED